MSRLRFKVRVKPGATLDRVGGSWGEAGALVVAVRAAAVDGRANKAVVELLAHALDVTRGRVSIVTGRTSRTKLIQLDGPPAGAEERLRQLLAED